MGRKLTETKEKMLLCGKRLKKCRKMAGYTQEGLEEAIYNLPENRGKPRNAKHISCLENGTRPISIEYAKLLSKILGVQENYLLGIDDDETYGKHIATKFKNIQKHNECIEYLISELGVIFESGTNRWWEIKIQDKHENEKISDKIQQIRIDDDCREETIKEIIVISPDGKQIHSSTKKIDRLYDDISSYIKYRVMQEFQ